MLERLALRRRSPALKSVASRTAGARRGCDRVCMPRTVLIVDDHASFRATARALLEADGLDVVGEAADGATALAVARRLHPDVVLLDVHLPDADGFTLAAELTAGGGPPAVVLTSSRDRSDFGRLVGHCGACGFVPKGELSGAALAALVG